MEPIPLISYSDFIVILLTALAVLLTALAIGIGIFAVFGYTSLRDGVKAAVQKQVTAVMDAKMKEYSEANEMIELTERVDALEAAIGGLDQLKNKILTGPAPREDTAASNSMVQEHVELAPQEIPTYPEQEAPDASNPAARIKPVENDNGTDDS